MLDRSDKNHRQIKRFLEEFPGRMLITWPVLAEACRFFSERTQIRFLRWAAAWRIGRGGGPRNRTLRDRRMEGKASRPADRPGRRLIAVGGGTDRHHGHPHDRLAGLLRV